MLVGTTAQDTSPQTNRENMLSMDQALGVKYGQAATLNHASQKTNSTEIQSNLKIIDVKFYNNNNLKGIYIYVDIFQLGAGWGVWILLWVKEQKWRVG